MNRFAALSLAALLAAPLCAQDVSFAAHVQDGKAVCYYCPGYDYVIDNTHASLHSSTQSLAQFVNLYVTGTGVWNGSTTAPTIDVTSIQVAPETFSIGGSATLGSQINFTVFGQPGDTAITLVGFKDGFVPVAGWGVVFLDPASLFVLGQGTVNSSGEFKIKVNLPNNTALIGLQVFGQAGVIASGGGTHLSNPDLRIIG